MNRTTAFRVTAMSALALMAGAASAFPAAAAPSSDSSPAAEAAAASPAMLAALQRDLGLTAQQALDRLAAEAVAATAEQQLSDSLGAAFGGAYFDPDSGTLVVGVTDAAQADEVVAAGAEPVTVEHSAAELDGVKNQLDQLADASGDLTGVNGWYVDTESNTVVVTVNPTAAGPAADVFVESAEATSSAIQVVEEAESPRLMYDVVGGQAYYINNQWRCSIGFSVVGGFVTAGHCGEPGDTTTGYNQVDQGEVRGSSFPGNDYGWVEVNSNWTPQPWVVNGSSQVTVAGSTEAAVGASVCRSGSTTGWHCGTIQAKNQTVNYAEGSVSGLTRTNACAEGGDSGGSWLSGQQAQGVTSGGSGNCTIGGTTYFQPVNEILDVYGLTLVTG